MCTHVGTKGRNLGLSAIIGFYSLLIISEITYQIYKTQKQTLKDVYDIMSQKEFEKRCNSGEQLVILDDYVLKVDSFMNYHPGGKFSIQQNVGRDVSKFFYGGYQMDGTDSSSTKPHTHSNYSLLTANKLIIAKYF